VLVDGRQTAELYPVTDLHMPAHGRAVGEDHLVADPAVVRDVGIRHEQAVRTDARDAMTLGRTAVHGAELAKHIALADDELRRLALVLLVLRRRPQGGELE